MPFKRMKSITSPTVSTSQLNYRGSVPVEEAVSQAAEPRTFEKALARQVSDGDSYRTELIVEIQGRGSHLPLFAVVVPGMDTRHLFTLSRYLGDDQPFYRIQAPGARLKGRPYSSTEFEQLAEEYTHGMKIVQPKGPYHLYGM